MLLPRRWSVVLSLLLGFSWAQQRQLGGHGVTSQDSEEVAPTGRGAGGGNSSLEGEQTSLDAGAPLNASNISQSVTSAGSDKEEEGDPEQMKDTPVLAFVLWGWTMMFVMPKLWPWLWPYVKSCMRATCPARCERRLEARIDSFTTTHEHDEIWEKLPSEWLAKRPYITIRDFINREYPPDPHCTFQMAYKNTRKELYWKHAVDSAIHQVWKFVILVGLVAMSLSWWVRFAPTLYGLYPYSFFHPNAVYANLNACGQIHKIVLTLASFLLSLYLNNRVRIFFNLMNHCWGMQSKLHDIALLMGTYMLPHRSDPFVAEGLYCLYRYLNLVHFYMYQPVCKRMSLISSDDLINAGLLLEHEAEELERISNKKNQVTLWIASWVHKAIEKGFMEPIYAHNLMDAIKSMRAYSSTLSKEVVRKVPLSFAQLIQLVIDGANLLTPPALAYAFRSENDGMSVYTWPAIGSMIIALFYQGGVRIVQALEEPFGADIDDLNPDWCLATSDTKIFRFLVASTISLPDFLKNRMDTPVNEAGEEFPFCDVDDLPTQDEQGKYVAPTTTALSSGGRRGGLATRNFPHAIRKGRDSVATKWYADPTRRDDVSEDADVRIEMDDGQYSDEEDGTYYSDEEDNRTAASMPLGSERSWSPGQPLALPEIPTGRREERHHNVHGRAQRLVLAVDFHNDAIHQVEDLLHRKLGAAKVRAKEPPLAAKPIEKPEPTLIEEVNSTDKMMIDLLARFHGELRSNAELRANMAAMNPTEVEHQPFVPPQEIEKPQSNPSVPVTPAHRAAAADVFRNAQRADYGATARSARQRALPPSRQQARQALMGRGTPSQTQPAALGNAPSMGKGKGKGQGSSYPALSNGPNGKYRQNEIW